MSSATGIPYGGIKRLAPERIRELERLGGDMAHDEKAQEIRQDPLLRKIQDVAISTRIAINHATTALDYAQSSLSDAGDKAAEKVGQASKEAKQRAKDLEKAEKKLQRAIDEMRKVKGSLDDALRRRG